MIKNENSYWLPIAQRSTFPMENLRRLVREKFQPHAGEWDREERFPVDAIRMLHESGYLSAFVPESLGGVGATTLDMLWIAREISYVSRGMACTVAAQMLSMMPIFLYGQEKLRQEVARSVLETGALGSFCFTEPDAGSDVLRIRTTARRVPGGYEITGKKCFITNAHYAKHFVVMARLEGVEDPKRALNAFYLPQGSRGLSFGAPLSKLGFRDSDTTEVYLENVFVPEENRLGEEGQGLSIALRSLQRSRTYFAGSAVGLCDRTKDLLTDFLGSRVHYGKPLLEQPQIRGQIAQLETQAHALWLMGCEASALWESGATSLLSSSMAKLYSGQVAMQYASAAVELFGAWGCTTEYEISRIFRDAKFFEIVEGPTFVQHVIIAKEILKTETKRIENNRAA